MYNYIFYVNYTLLFLFKRVNNFTINDCKKCVFCCSDLFSPNNNDFLHIRLYLYETGNLHLTLTLTLILFLFSSVFL